MTMSMKPQDLIGHDVYDPDGEKIGRVETVYVGEESHEPEWVTVRTGLFGHRETFVPLAGAHTDADGVRVGVRKDVVKDAPHVDAEGKLSEQEGIDLRRYYGLPIQRGSTGPVSRPGGEQPRMRLAPDQADGTMTDRTAADRGMSDRTAADRSMADRAMSDRAMGDPAHAERTSADLAGKGTADPMAGKHDLREPDREQALRERAMRAKQDTNGTQNMAPQGRTTHAPAREKSLADRGGEQIVIRSEERLRVETERVEAGHVRLRKYVVTEPQQVTVQLTHEEVHVVREPIGETELTTLKADPKSFAESVVEVTLHKDQPVIIKDTVPVERIRLATRPVTMEHTVTDEIRKEQFDVIDDTKAVQDKPGDKPRH
ncbi:DUF2382 domain-containing protein [Actinokineospora sp. HUAS TT18]|uniref:DUF2382 domain-containing protein n=1 Tax=Actinokineospora sp. HUAS TT18 TaxID=3447451 RepID=UPI003F525EBD